MPTDALVKSGAEPAAEWVDPSTLVPWPRNPRKHSPAEIERVAVSLDRFGFGAPIVARRETREIIAGHRRQLAALKRQWTLVPVRFMDLSDRDAHLLALADNRLGEDPEWDVPALWDVLKGFDIDEAALAGWSADELNAMAELSSDTGSQGDTEEEAPKGGLKDLRLDDLAPTGEERARLEGRKLLIEFSGGKDSSATAVWAKYFFPDSEIELVFVDLGADFVGMPIFLQEFSEALVVPLRVLRSKRGMHEEFLRMGKWPHWKGPFCQNLLHNALDEYVKRHEPHTVAILRGGRSEEKKASERGKAKTRWLEIKRKPEYLYFQPLYWAAKEVGEAIVTECGLPLWPGYATGLKRTACRICPGQSTVAYAVIRDRYPAVWDELLWFERRFGPGCWSDAAKQGRGSLEDNANRGAKRL